MRFSLLVAGLLFNFLYSFLLPAIASDLAVLKPSRRNGHRCHHYHHHHHPHLLHHHHRRGQQRDQRKPMAVATSATAAATELMASRGEVDAPAALRAYNLLDAELASADGSPGGKSGEPAPAPHSNATAAAASRALAKLTAGALLTWIRCSTAGNCLMVADGGQVATSDTVDKQRLWAEHAPKVLQLVREAGVDPASDAELQHIYTEAIMYSVCSQGIVQAFVTGKALKFFSAVKTMASNFPKQDNGIAFIFKGSYYLVAPWPVRSPKKARENYEMAVKVNGRSRRNLYYAGLGRLVCGDHDGAREMFSRAVSVEQSENASGSDRDIASTLMEQSQRGLDFCTRQT